MGIAVIARTDQFRHRDFHPRRKVPPRIQESFVGFFGSMEEVNVLLRSGKPLRLRLTPAHLT